MDKRITFEDFITLKERVYEIEKRLSAFAEMKADAVQENLDGFSDALTGEGDTQAYAEQLNMLVAEVVQQQGFDDETATGFVELFPAWVETKSYAEGDKVKHNGVLYKCLQRHDAQVDWTPTAAPSLWAKVLTDPSGDILPWEQPDSTNPYMKGDKVTHNGKTWESDVDNNVWEPGVYGWSEI